MKQNQNEVISPIHSETVETHWKSYVGHILEDPAGYLKFAAYENGKFTIKEHGGPNNFIEHIGTPEEIARRFAFSDRFRQDFFTMDYIMPPLSESELALGQTVTAADGAHQRYLLEKEDRMRYPENSQEPTSLLTAPSVRLSIAPQYPWASLDQLDEIAAGLRENLTPEQVNLYARPEFSAIQMNSLRYALQDGLSMAQLQLIADPAFTSVQMDVLRCCFQAGMTMDQMTDFAKPEVPAQQMLERYWAVKQGQELALQQAQAADPEPAADVSCEPEFGQDL